MRILEKFLLIAMFGSCEQFRDICRAYIRNKIFIGVAAISKMTASASKMHCYLGGPTVTNIRIISDVICVLF